MTPWGENKGWVFHDVAAELRRTEWPRAGSLVCCALFLGLTVGWSACLAWLLSAVLVELIVSRASRPKNSKGDITARERLFIFTTMTLQTATWSSSAVLFWRTEQPFMQMAGLLILAAQLIYLQTFTYRSVRLLLLCAAPPCLTLLALPLVFRAESGLELAGLMAAVLTLIYYAASSAWANRQAMVLMEQQRAYVTGVIESLGARIGVVDRQGYIIHANRAWRDRLRELAALNGEPVGTHFMEHCAKLPGKQGVVLSDGLADLIAGRRDSFAAVYRTDFTSKTEWFKLNATPLTGAGDARLVVVQHRITELKATEEKLRRTNQTLRRAREEAEAANRAKSMFLATMSHEIRTPLNGVVAIADVLAHSDLKESERDMVETIRASANTLSRLLADMLDLARIESGRIDLERRPFELAETVRGVLALSDLAAREKGVHLAADIDPAAEVWAMGDQTRFKQILTNLISNAVKFTAVGEVRLSLKRRPRGWWEVKVSDTGIGFDPAQKKRLFERFEQADGTVTRRFGGSGLGLAIVQQLVGLMGGELDCESELGKGSVFMVRLRLPLAKAPQQTADAAPLTSADRPLNILVVDDHPTNRKVVELILRGLDARLTMAENGLEALRAFEAQPFDAVLMDIQMPVMDGLAATVALREMERERDLPRTPVIMFSASALSEDVASSRTAGADLHLAKPVSAAELLSALSLVLANAPAASPKDAAPRDSLAGS